MSQGEELPTYSLHINIDINNQIFTIYRFCFITKNKWKYISSSIYITMLFVIFSYLYGSIEVQSYTHYLRHIYRVSHELGTVKKLFKVSIWKLKSYKFNLYSTQTATRYYQIAVIIIHYFNIIYIIWYLRYITLFKYKTSK